MYNFSIVIILNYLMSYIKLLKSQQIN